VIRADGCPTSRSSGPEARGARPRPLGADVIIDRSEAGLRGGDLLGCLREAFDLARHL